MLNLTWLLAQADVKDIEHLREGTRNSPQIFGTDITIVLGAALAFAAIFFFWAFFIRKKPREARGSFVVERGSKGSRDGKHSSGRGKRRKRREEHPGNWTRNPTLSETGGLPPLRPDETETPPRS